MMNRFLIVVALALILGACSTMNVTLEKNKMDEVIVSTVATAPTSVSFPTLVKKAHKAMGNVCGDIQQFYAAREFLECHRHAEDGSVQPCDDPDAKEEGIVATTSKVANLAESITKLRDAVKGWIPMNTYTAARKCAVTPSPDSE